MKTIQRITVVAAAVALSACAATGEQYGSNVYTAQQVNSRQAAKTVDILAVLPAKVAVDNTQNQRRAAVAGAILGAIAGGLLGGGLTHGQNAGAVGVVGAAAGGVAGNAAGSMVSSTTLVDGVSLTYRDEGQVFNSAQVGRPCEYHAGTAVMIATNASETRIQPNGVCPQPQ